MMILSVQLIIFLDLYLMRSGVLPACTSVHHMKACSPWKPEEGILSPATGITDGCKQPCGSWQLNLGLLEEKPVLLIVKPSLYPCHPEKKILYLYKP